MSQPISTLTDTLLPYPTLFRSPEDNRRLANLCGPLDENLRQIEAAFDITIGRRGSSFRFSGDAAQAEKGAQAIEHFYNRAHDELSLDRSEEHTSELQSIMRISYAVFCLKTKKKNTKHKQ